MNATPRQVVSPPATSLPEWTNNRLVGGAIIVVATAFLSIFGTLLVNYWVFSGRISNIEHQWTVLTEKSAKVDELRVVSERLSSENLQLVQKASDHVDEITLLRNKVNQLEVDAVQRGQSLVDLIPRMGTLEADHKETRAGLATVRERVAKIEGAANVKP